MTYKKAKKLALQSKWKAIVCNQGESCWCKIVAPEVPIEYEYISNGQKKKAQLDCIISPGDVDKEFAEHIVSLHNSSLNL